MARGKGAASQILKNLSKIYLCENEDLHRAESMADGDPCRMRKCASVQKKIPVYIKGKTRGPKTRITTWRHRRTSVSDAGSVSRAEPSRQLSAPRHLSPKGWRARYVFPIRRHPQRGASKRLRSDSPNSASTRARTCRTARTRPGAHRASACRAGTRSSFRR